MVENSDVLWRNLLTVIQKMQSALKIRLNYVVLLAYFFCFYVAKAIMWSISASKTYQKHIS